MDLEKLRQRLPNQTDDEFKQIVNIIQRYDLKLNIKNFDQYGLRLIDTSKRVVRVCNGDLRQGKVHVQNPHADIAIVFADGLLAGWTSEDKLEDIVDRMLIDVKALNPMPDTFNFRQPCAHMSVHGGFYDGEFWQCAGCGQKLIFNDKV